MVASQSVCRWWLTGDWIARQASRPSLRKKDTTAVMAAACFAPRRGIRGGDQRKVSAGNADGFIVRLNCVACNEWTTPPAKSRGNGERFELDFGAT